MCMHFCVHVRVYILHIYIYYILYNCAMKFILVLFHTCTLCVFESTSRCNVKVALVSQVRPYIQLSIKLK